MNRSLDRGCPRWEAPCVTLGSERGALLSAPPGGPPSAGGAEGGTGGCRWIWTGYRTLVAIV